MFGRLNCTLCHGEGWVPLRELGVARSRLSDDAAYKRCPGCHPPGQPPESQKTAPPPRGSGAGLVQRKKEQ